MGVLVLVAVGKAGSTVTTAVTQGIGVGRAAPAAPCTQTMLYWVLGAGACGSTW